MNKHITLRSALSLMFVLLLSTICLWSNHPAKGASTIIVPDDHSTIQEAINSAIEGDTIFVRIGVYYEHVVVHKRISLVGENSSATVIDGNWTGRVMYVVSDNVNITDFTVQRSGSLVSPTIDAGISLDSVTHCNISGNRVIDNGFAGISLEYSQRNTITGNRIGNTTWGGIHLLSSSNNKISRNILTNNTIVGINGHASSHYNNITENDISNSNYGMFYHDANYNTIRENNISTIAIEGIEFQDQVSYNTIVDNYLINCGVGIKLFGPNYRNVISRNFLANGQSGIRIQNARYTEIYNNTITQNYGSGWDAGIRLDYAADSVIHSNLIVDNWRGILIYTTSPNVSIYDNTIARNEFGVRVASGGSNYLNVSRNVVMHNRGYGIGLTGFTSGSHYATISRNTLINNSDGIALGQYSNYNMICQNNISQNNYGFFIEYSTQNTIWHNNIVNNDLQAFVATGSVNNWSDDYPAGGNYWSNYSGADIYCGPNQDLLGGDGLGDCPHIIDADNLDLYPLVEQRSWAPNNIAVKAVALSRSIVGKGSNLYANVTAENQGHSFEAFNVTLYANATALETREVVLSAGNSIILTLAWNTSAFAYGNYTIWAYAEPVSGEAHMVDNTYVAGLVTVTIPGDVDGDGDVDIFDIVKMAGKYGVHKPDSRYEANCDLDGDGDIDIFDIVIAAGHYGESYRP